MQVAQLEQADVVEGHLRFKKELHGGRLLGKVDMCSVRIDNYIYI